jgi:F1F0 ATPase subunit 2
MNETLSLVPALAVGMTLGTLFFAGLWWTVRQGLASDSPALWFFSSLLLRTGIALMGFHYVAKGSGGKLLMCLFGFFVAHHIVVRFAREAKHAS